MINIVLNLEVIVLEPCQTHKRIQVAESKFSFDNLGHL